MIPRFRRIWRFLTPPWLQNEEGDGPKVLYSIGLLIDMFAERARQGLEARMPSRAGPSAQALIAGDRGLIRGRSEPDEDLPGKPPGFVSRLLAWRTPRTHCVRGNAYEAVRQVWNYWWHWNPGYADVFDSHFLTHFKEANGAEGRFDFGVWNWDGTDPDVHWSRFWVTIDNDGITEQLDFGDPDLWGGALNTPGYTLGQQNVRPEDVLAMRTLFQDLPWAPAHARPEWVIVTSEDIGGGSFPSPDGTWGHWSQNVGGTQVATRAPEYRYWALGPEVNFYSGDPENFPEAMTDVDGGGTYEGDPDSFPASITLPNGTVYVGDPDSFPVGFQLVDDGSIPR